MMKHLGPAIRQYEFSIKWTDLNGIVLKTYTPQEANQAKSAQHEAMNDAFSVILCSAWNVEKSFDNSSQHEMSMQHFLCQHLSAAQAAARAHKISLAVDWNSKKISMTITFSEGEAFAARWLKACADGFHNNNNNHRETMKGLLADNV